MSVNIEITINGQKMTMKEAEALYKELCKLFDKPATIPNWSPVTYRGTSVSPQPSYPYDVWCSSAALDEAKQ